MSFDKWSASEKKIARRAFDAALAKEFAELNGRLKAMTAKLVPPATTWEMHEYLSGRLRAIARRYDYRYS